MTKKIKRFLTFLVCALFFAFPFYPVYADNDIESSQTAGIVEDLAHSQTNTPNVSISGIVQEDFYDNLQDIYICFIGEGGDQHYLYLLPSNNYMANVYLPEGVYQVLISHTGDKDMYKSFTFDSEFEVFSNNLNTLDFVMGTDIFIEKNKKSLSTYEANEESLEKANNVHKELYGESLFETTEEKDDSHSTDNIKKHFLIFPIIFIIFIITLIITILILKRKRRE